LKGIVLTFLMQDLSRLPMYGFRRTASGARLPAHGFRSTAGTWPPACGFQRSAQAARLLAE
jgi:hypothetical protein